MGRVLLTGGTGFVGGALLRRLLERGDDVVALARSPESAEAIEAAGARPARGDVLEEDSVAAAMAGCDLVYHVAGVNTHCPDDPDTLLRVNAEGPPNVVRAAARAGIGRVVFTSSSATVGEPHGTIGREDTAHRGNYLSLYERSKRLGEDAAVRRVA